MATTTMGVRYSETDDREPEWLWDRFVVMEDVNLFVGPEKIGKLFMLAELVAIVTNGWPMPDGEITGPPGSVIMITPEDKRYVVKMRLKAAGADLDKVYDLSRETTIPGGIKFKVPMDLTLLRRKIRELKDCRLVIIDPLMATAAYNVMNNKIAREKYIEPLQAVAEDTGIAIVLIHHFVKDGSIGGSKGLVDACRVVNIVMPNQHNEDVRELRMHRNNLAPMDQEPYRYVIEGDGPDARIRWLGDDEEAPIRPGEDPRPGTGQHEILTLLRDRGVMSGQQLAAELDKPYDTTRVLLKRLCDAGLVERPLGMRGVFQAVDLDATGPIPVVDSPPVTVTSP